jgi:hypothetical protein
VKASAAFPSAYLKKEDLGDKKVLLTVDRVEMQDVGQGDQMENKPVLYFAGHDKGMVLNRGNADAITEINSGDDEMDNWHGLRVVLYVDRNVMYAGKRVGGIRIAPPPQDKGRPVPPPPAAVVEGFQATDDDVPFGLLVPILATLGLMGAMLA